MNFGRAIGLFNKFTPKISKGIGQVANIARNVGQAVQNVRNIGSTVNAMSGGRIGSTPFGQKMQAITNTVESGANQAVQRVPETRCPALNLKLRASSVHEF